MATGMGPTRAAQDCSGAAMAAQGGLDPLAVGGGGGPLQGHRSRPAAAGQAPNLSRRQARMRAPAADCADAGAPARSLAARHRPYAAGHAGRGRRRQGLYRAGRQLQSRAGQLRRRDLGARQQRQARRDERFHSARANAPELRDERPAMAKPVGDDALLRARLVGRTGRRLGRFISSIAIRLMRRWSWVLRSAGPAGAPLQRLRREGDAIAIGSGWTMTMPSQARPVAMGSEHDKDWTSAETKATDVAHADGWSYARLAVGASIGDWLIRPAAPPAPSAITLPAPVALPRIEGGDPQFRESLDAQLSTLLIGLVGDQTRPAKRCTIRSNGCGTALMWWWRCAGRDRSISHARWRSASPGRIFFGGFGSEADAPGLALWLLAETSAAQPDGAFAQVVWPDVVRKAGWIDTLLHARADCARAFRRPGPARAARQRRAGPGGATGAQRAHHWPDGRPLSDLLRQRDGLCRARERRADRGHDRQGQGSAGLARAGPDLAAGMGGAALRASCIAAWPSGRSTASA